MLKLENLAKEPCTHKKYIFYLLDLKRSWIHSYKKKTKTKTKMIKELGKT